MLDSIYSYCAIFLASFVAIFVTFLVGKSTGKKDEQLEQEKKASNAKTTAIKLRNSADVDKLYNKYHTK